MSTSTIESPSTPRRLLLELGAFCLLGVAFAEWLNETFSGRPDPRNWYSAFYVIFARDESLGLAVAALFSVIAAAFMRKSDHGAASQSSTHRIFLLSALIAVFTITALGTHFVCHDYLLSADEYAADFQARIFSRGQITAEVPPQWIPLARLIKPTYVDYFPETHRWKGAYLPVYSAIRAAFQCVYLDSILNPFLAAITVLSFYGLVRNVWPEKKQYAVVAVLLLGTSSQFLVMAMTGYSMAAHLALNTVWLWLYSRPRCRRFYLAPVVGVFAIGLHQPIVHALFVTPFLLRLVRQRRWRIVFVFGLIYSAGCAGWYLWRLHYSAPSNPGLAPFFRIWNSKILIIQPMDLLLLIGWSALATPLLAALGFRHIFKSRPIVQDAALSCLVTFGFYFFFVFDQGHGWGYRYFHGTITCLILVALWGWEKLITIVGSRPARNFLLTGTMASLVLLLPLRCYQAETFTRPFARASEEMHKMDAQVVGLAPAMAWYSADLIRNEPFLNDRPVICKLIQITPEEVSVLERVKASRIVTKEELRSWGLATVPQSDIRYDPFRLGVQP